MSARTEQRVRDVFDAAVDLSAPERAAFVSRECGDDERLAAEVHSLLAALDQGGDALDTDAADVLGFSDRSTRPTRDGFATTGMFGAEIVGVSIGGYKLVRLVGRGGMGSVYEAIQENPRRSVALKVMRPWAGGSGGEGGGSGRGARRRFVEEAQILARLRHPGIAQVFAAGTHALAQSTPEQAALAAALGVGQTVPWMAMEFVEGARSVTAFATETKMSPRQRLVLFADACDAVHHGHIKGVIHRDLKPANMLVDSSGRIKIIDFGVARVANPDAIGGGAGTVAASMTMAGSLVGTLRYMSPEQCDGDPHALDTRSDVYSLGVVLYELMVGAMPYDLGDGSFSTALRAIREDAPAPPSSVQPLLRGDTERILLKALAKERERRYQSAADFAADIRRFLANQPIHARSAGLAYRAAKFARRHTAVVALGAVTIAAVVAGVVGVGVSLSEAIKAERRAKAGRLEAERQSYVANIVAADAAINAHDGVTAMTRLNAAPPSRRGWEWGYLRAAADQSVQRVALPGNGSEAAVSPDGRLIVACAKSGVVNGIDSRTGSVLWTTPDMRGSGEVPRFSPDGTMVLVPGKARATLVNAADGREIRRFVLPDRVMAIGAAISADGLLVALGCDNRYGLRVFDARTGAEVFGVPCQCWLYAPDFSPDGRLLAASEFPDTVILDARRWTEVRRIRTGRPNFAEPSTVRFSPDGQTIAVAVGLTIEIYDVATGALVRTLRGHSQRIPTIEFNPTGDRLASGSVDKTLRIWNLAAAETAPPVVLMGHGAIVNSARFVSVSDGKAGDEEQVWSTAEEPTARRWTPATTGATNSFKFVAPAMQVHSLSFDRRSQTLAASCGYHVATWDLGASALRPAPTPVGTMYAGVNAEFHVACGIEQGPLAVVRDIDSGDLRWAVPIPTTNTQVSYISPDGKLAAFAIDGDIVRLLRADNGSGNIELRGHTNRVHWVRFAGDSLWALTAAEDGTARIWDTATGNERARFATPGQAALRAELSPDGTLVASGGGDELVHLWQPETGVEVRTLSGFRSTVWSVAFSPDGQRLAVGSQDRVARVFDVSTGDELLQLRRHTGSVMSLAWSPDGRYLATGGYDQRVFIWDAGAGVERAGSER